jgi:hypothetical protein
MFNYPSIYEINTRVWLNRFNTPERKAKLSDVPLDYWKSLKDFGIDYVWLMGIWKTCPPTIEKYCFEDGLQKNYSKALKDWEREDIIGSPYSIDVYEVNPSLGTNEELAELKQKLNHMGMKLVLDFIPNHFSADSSLIKYNPGIFLQVEEPIYKNEKHTFYQPDTAKQKYFAHGRDPFFSAWQDTIQVNYCSRLARDFMIQTLIDVSKICDGVRCDMAMLMLNNVFKNTWAGVIPSECKTEKHPEFWLESIIAVKRTRKDFLFIAEAYWDLEWSLQLLGFDYTYDKRLTDRLKHSSAHEIRDHLLAEMNYQLRSLRFLENHDEERSIVDFGKEKSKAAAIIISTIPGAHFYNDGQFIGSKIKLPVQLGREPEESVNEEIQKFYKRVLAITSQRIFKSGDWKLLKINPSWENNSSYHNILAWELRFGGERRIVVVNYSASTSTCRLMLDVVGYVEEFVLIDLLNDVAYNRSAEEIYRLGLYVELKSYQAHIFSL